MADNGILILYNRIYIFIDKKNKRGNPLYYSNKMHNKKVEYNKNGII